jgi:Rps23 Pro-64 3,4-dihydroxylase Tpa1-like proline 4-hydroxylase
MQPKIIENFISTSTCKYLNDYFLNSIPLDEQGYANVYVNKFLSFYDKEYLLKTLDKQIPDQALFYDVLNLIYISIKAQFPFAKDDIEIELFNYRSFGAGQKYLGYHADNYGGPGTLYSALLYITDDYEGGEIIFYDEDFPDDSSPVTYKPKAGSLFLFTSIDGHKVNPVISGKRALFIIHLRTPPAI